MGYLSISYGSNKMNGIIHQDDMIYPWKLYQYFQPWQQQHLMLDSSIWISQLDCICAAVVKDHRENIEI